MKAPTELKQRIAGLLPQGAGEEAHRARVLMVAGLMFVTGGVLISLMQVVLWVHPDFLPAPPGDLAVDVLVLLLGGLMVWLVLSGRMRAASWVVLGSLLLIALVHLYVEGRPAKDVAGGLASFLVITLAFVLLDRRSAWLVSVISAASFVAMNLLWLEGRLPPPVARNPSSQAAFSIVTWLAAAGIVAAVISSTMAALRRHRDHLEEMVEERTAQQKEMAERLMEQERLTVVGQLAGGVSHELHNPLGVIKNATYFLNMVLGERETEPEVEEALDIIEEQVERSERIIGDLLDFAEQESPAWRDVNVNDVVQAALSRAVLPDDVAVVTELDPALPQVLADPDQLAQAFGNLIRNAVQAIGAPPVPPARGREARLTVRSFESAGGVAVSIADTGAGIAEENLERIFEPLFTTRAQGIGLGLALAERLVEAHGGTIEVESEVGEGSVFTVRLPVRRE